ncbi:MAG: sigma-70 family RNA polymerase sigma factor [Rubrivivax sp.]
MNATSSRTLSSDGPPGPPDAADALFDDPDPGADLASDAESGVDGAGSAAPLASHAAALPGASDEQLARWIDAIVDHDERALSALYDATVSRVYGIVRCVVRNAALAEEVVEDTFFQVWRQAVRYDPSRGRALTWLLGMARSRAIDALRRESRFQAESLDDENAPERADTASPPGDELLELARCHADLHRALMQLQAQPRQLVALAFFRGLSHEEIATQTALPLGTVKSQIRRALITLRQMLGEQGLPVLAS